MVSLGTLEIGLRLNKTDYDRGITQARRDLSRLTIVPFVDHKPLIRLNEHLDEKVVHLKQVQSYLNSNPLKVSVDESSFNTISKLTRGESKLKVEIDTSDLKKSIREAFKDSADEFQKAVEKGTKKGNSKGLLGTLLTPFTLVGTGIFEGLGFGFAQSIAKGFTAKIDKTLEGFGRKSSIYLLRRGKQIGEELAKSFGYDDGLKEVAKDLDDIAKRIDGLLNPVEFQAKAKVFEDTLVEMFEAVAENNPEKAMSKFKEAFKPATDVAGEVAFRAGGVGLRVAAQPFRIRQRVQLAQSAKEALELAKALEIVDKKAAGAAESIAIITGGINFEKGGVNTDFAANLIQQLLPNAYTQKVYNAEANEPSGFLLEFRKMLGSLTGMGEEMSEPMPLDKLLEAAVEKGHFPDSIKMAAHAVAYRQQYPDKPIHLFGTSGGSYIVENAIAILEKLGIKNVKGAGLTAPYAGLTATANPKNFQGFVGDVDPLYLAMFGGRFSSQKGEYAYERTLEEIPVQLPFLMTPSKGLSQVTPGAGEAHALLQFLANPDFQKRLSKFLEVNIPSELSGEEGVRNLDFYRGIGDEAKSLTRTMLGMAGDPQARKEAAIGEKENYAFFHPKHMDWRRDNDLRAMMRNARKKAKRTSGEIRKAAEEYLNFLENLEKELVTYYETQGKSGISKELMAQGAQFLPGVAAFDPEVALKAAELESSRKLASQSAVEKVTQPLSQVKEIKVAPPPLGGRLASEEFTLAGLKEIGKSLGFKQTQLPKLKKALAEFIASQEEAQVLGVIKSLGDTVKSKKFLEGKLDLRPTLETEQIENINRLLSENYKQIDRAIQELANNAQNLTEQQVTEQTTNISEKIKSQVNGIRKILSEINLSGEVAQQLGGRHTSFGNLEGQLEAVSKDAIKGLSQGVNQGEAKVQQLGAQLGEALERGAKKNLKIESPSGVFRDEVGKPIGQGIAKGIEQSAHLSKKAIASLADDLVIEIGRKINAGLETGIDLETIIENLEPKLKAAIAALEKSVELGAVNKQLKEKFPSTDLNPAESATSDLDQWYISHFTRPANLYKLLKQGFRSDSSKERAFYEEQVFGRQGPLYGALRNKYHGTKDFTRQQGLYGPVEVAINSRDLAHLTTWMPKDTGNQFLALAKLGITDLKEILDALIEKFRVLAEVMPKPEVMKNYESFLPYVEAQVHTPVTPGHIESVNFREDSFKQLYEQNPQQALKLVQLATNQGISVQGTFSKEFIEEAAQLGIAIEKGVARSFKTIEAKWKKTSAIIATEIIRLESVAAKEGYEIQKDISEGSPGPTQRIRQYWAKTVQFIKAQIASIPSNEVSQKLEETLPKMAKRRSTSPKSWGQSAAEGIKSIPDDFAKTLSDSVEKAAIETGKNSLDFLVKSFKNVGSVIEALTEKFPLLGKLSGILKTVGISALTLFGAFTFGDIIVRTSTNVLNLTKRFEGLNLALKLVPNGAKLYDDVRAQVNRLGGDLEATTKAGLRFSASLINSPLKNQANEFYLSINDSLTKLNLSNEEKERALTAIIQMASRERISLEEVTGQLAEAVPGSTALIAEAMNTTTADLIARIEKGDVLFEELGPAFVEGLERRTAIIGGQYEKTLTAATGRLQAQATELGLKVGEQLAPGTVQLLDTFNNLMRNVVNNLGSIVLLTKAAALSAFLYLTPWKELGGLIMGAWKAVGGLIMGAAAQLAHLFFTGKLVAAAMTSVAFAFKAFVVPAALLAGIETIFYLFKKGSSEVRDANLNIVNSVDKIREAYEKANAARTQRTQPIPSRPEASGIGGFWDKYVINPLSKLFGREPVATYGDMEQTRKQEEIQKGLNELSSGANLSAGNLFKPEKVDEFITSISKLNDEINSLSGKGKALRLIDPVKNKAEIKSIDEQLTALRDKRELLNEKFIPGGRGGLEQLKQQAEAYKDVLLSLQAKGYDVQTPIQEINNLLGLVNRSLTKTDQIAEDISNQFNEQRKALINLNASIARKEEGFNISSALKKAALYEQQAKGIKGLKFAEEDLTKLELQQQQRRLINLQSYQKDRLEFLKGIDENTRTTIETITGKPITKTDAGDLVKIQKTIENNTSLKQSIEGIVDVLSQFTQSKQDIATTKESIGQAKVSLKRQTFEIQDYYRNLNRQIEDFNRDTARQAVDLGRQVRNFNRSLEDASLNAFRESRSLKESYEDLMFDLSKQIKQTSISITNIRQQIANTRLKNDLLRGLTPGVDSLAKQLTNIVVDALDSLAGFDTERRSLDGQVDDINQNYTQTLRRIRDLQEQQLDIERQRLRLQQDLLDQQVDLARSIADFVRNAKRTIEDLKISIERDLGAAGQPYIDKINPVPTAPSLPPVQYQAPPGYGQSITTPYQTAPQQSYIVPPNSSTNVSPGYYTQTPLSSGSQKHTYTPPTGSSKLDNLLQQHGLQDNVPGYQETIIQPRPVYQSPQSYTPQSYSPSPTSGNGETVTGRASIITNYLRSQGFTKAGIAAVLGTFRQEGTDNGIIFNPYAYNEKSGATGMPQYLGNRKANMPAFTGNLNTDLTNQLKYFVAELKGVNGEGQSGKLLKILTSTNDLNQAMGAMNRYERFAGYQNPVTGKETGARYQYARDYYDQLGGLQSAQPTEFVIASAGVSDISQGLNPASTIPGFAPLPQNDYPALQSKGNKLRELQLEELGLKGQVIDENEATKLIQLSDTMGGLVKSTKEFVRQIGRGLRDTNVAVKDMVRGAKGFLTVNEQINQAVYTRHLEFVRQNDAINDDILKQREFLAGYQKQRALIEDAIAANPKLANVFNPWLADLDAAYNEAEPKLKELEALQLTLVGAEPLAVEATRKRTERDLGLQGQSQYAGYVSGINEGLAKGADPFSAIGLNQEAAKLRVTADFAQRRAEMNDFFDKYPEYAKNANNLYASLDSLEQLELKNAFIEANPYAQMFNETLESIFTSSQSVGDALRNLAISILKLFAAWAAKQLTSIIFGGGFSSGGGVGTTGDVTSVNTNVAAHGGFAIPVFGIGGNVSPMDLFLGVNEALKKERSLSGHKPALVVANEKEWILNPHDTKTYLKAKQLGLWDELQNMNTTVKNYANGGSIGTTISSGTTRNYSQSNHSNTTVNNYNTYNIENGNRLGESLSQIEARNDLQNERSKKRFS